MDFIKVWLSSLPCALPAGGLLSLFCLLVLASVRLCISVTCACHTVAVGILSRHTTHKTPNSNVRPIFVKGVMTTTGKEGNNPGEESA